MITTSDSSLGAEPLISSKASGWRLIVSSMSGLPGLKIRTELPDPLTRWSGLVADRRHGMITPAGAVRGDAVFRHNVVTIWHPATETPGAR